MLLREELFTQSGNEKGKKVLKLLARSGVCEVLFKLETGPRKFSQLMFDVKINPGALSRHLKTLVELGAVSKNDLEMYELTEYGRELISILRQFFEVGDYSKLRIRTSYFE
ncbi:MAG: transcriptional regulator [Archaeoglobi archaeon]|nr:MAG: transcriptional regulator [Archaeoglobi archaeon]